MIGDTEKNSFNFYSATLQLRGMEWNNLMNRIPAIERIVDWV